jgi:hypothetical protein
MLLPWDHIDWAKFQALTLLHLVENHLPAVL